MELDTLAANPTVISLLAGWHVREWSHLYPEWTVTAASAEFAGMLQSGGIPATLLAFAGSDRGAEGLLGSVSIIEDDELLGWEHVRPWLASLYVIPTARGRGVGRQLVTAAIAFARGNAAHQLHLFATAQDRFYHDLGWRHAGEATMNGHPVTVMKIDTAVDAPRRGFATQWCTSSFSRTAYSYLRPSSTPDDRDVLAQAVAPGVYLAGEATSRAFPGTAHGAWFSGERAAAQVMAELGGSPRVVVVGAGLAGIAAAQSAQANGAAVTVLEASSRCGGRATADHRLGGPVNVGAAWIHGTEGHPLFDAVSELSVEPHGNPLDEATTFVAGRGALIEAELASFGELYDRIQARIEHASSQSNDDDNVGDELARAFNDLSLDPTASTVLRCWIRGEYENLYAARPSDLSLKHGLEPFRLPGNDVMITCAMDEVIGALAANLEIRYDSRVDLVSTDDTSLTVKAADERFAADAVIVTVPVGVLSADAELFDPPLPTRVRAALSRIGAGLVTKAFFSFERAFWTPHRAFWIAADPPLTFELWVDVSVVRGAPTLCAFAVGDDARAVEQMTEDELLLSAWTTLRLAVGLIPG